ncbi:MULTISPECIES: hypothetical protein [unclassified Streptomyces]|uniref:hypothetical protein n=1 Tax=unclassified Streptomyces TaxID=2593676 RepID=UPI0033B8F4AA
MREPVVEKIRAAVELTGDPEDGETVRTDVYGRLWDLFNDVLLPALATEPGPERSEVLGRSFSFLERVAASPEPVVREFLGGLTGDYLIGRDGLLSYAHAGPKVRAVMVRACADWGLPVPADWTAS